MAGRTRGETRRKQSIDLVNDLLLTSMFLQRVGNREVRKYGLNQSQFTVLGEIVRKGGVQQKDILGRLLLEKSNLSKIVDKLVRMSLITLQTPDHDRRATVLNATDAGERVYRECSDTLDEMKTVFTDPLGDEELLDSVRAARLLKELVLTHLQDDGETRGDEL